MPPLSFNEAEMAARCEKALAATRRAQTALREALDASPSLARGPLQTALEYATNAERTAREDFAFFQAKAAEGHYHRALDEARVERIRRGRDATNAEVVHASACDTFRSLGNACTCGAAAAVNGTGMPAPPPPLPPWHEWWEIKGGEAFCPFDQARAGFQKALNAEATKAAELARWRGEVTRRQEAIYAHPRTCETCARHSPCETFDALAAGYRWAQAKAEAAG